MIDNVYMAYYRGILSGPDLNVLQEQMLLVYHHLEKENQIKEEEARFERDLFINNPLMYQDYIEKKDNLEIFSEDINYLPQNEEEEEEIRRIFEQSLSMTTKEQRAAPEHIIKQYGFENPLIGIDVDKLGDEE